MSRIWQPSLLILIIGLVALGAGCATNATPASSYTPFAVTPPYLAADLAKTTATRITASMATNTPPTFSSDITALPVPPVVTPLVSGTAPSIVTWQTFDGNGYTLRYPTGWFIYQSPPGAVDRTGVRYDLILSDAPGNQSSQSATSDESARVTIYYLPKSKQPLGEWVSQRWAWLDTMLTPATIDDVPALSATVLSTEPALLQEFLWIEYRGQYYTVHAYARADKPDMIDKFKSIVGSFRLLR